MAFHLPGGQPRPVGESWPDAGDQKPGRALTMITMTRQP
jgi:hypothetical protein